MHDSRSDGARATLKDPNLDEGELLLRLHSKLVHLHVSLAEAMSIDRSVHLRPLDELRGMIDAIQANERFRAANAERDSPGWSVSKT